LPPPFDGLFLEIVGLNHNAAMSHQHWKAKQSIAVGLFLVVWIAWTLARDDNQSGVRLEDMELKNTTATAEHGGGGGDDDDSHVSHDEERQSSSLNERLTLRPATSNSAVWKYCTASNTSSSASSDHVFLKLYIIVLNCRQYYGIMQTRK